MPFRLKLGLTLVTTLITFAAAAQTSAQSTQTQTTSPPPAAASGKSGSTPAKKANTGTSTKKNKKPAPAEDLGFTIEAPPTWIAPMPDVSDAALPSAPMHYTFLDHEDRVEADTETRYEQWIRVVDQVSGLDQAAQILIEFDPSWQKLVLHTLTLQRDGATTSRLDPKKVHLLQRETQLERRMVDGRLTMSINLDDVRVGDRIVFAYSLRGRNPVFEGKFVDRDTMASVRGPTALYRSRLLAPVDRTIQVLVPKDAVATTQMLGSERESIYIRKNIPQLVFDASVPESAYMSEVVDMSEFPDWASVAAWAQRTFSVADDGAQVQAKVQEIQAAAATPMERLTQALNFVQRDIRYFGTEIGPSSHRPTPPETVMQQRFGDCKDKVTLLVALLKQMQIEAVPTLASVHYREDAGRLLASPLAFDHVIARVRLDGHTYWLDGTRAHQSGPIEKRQSSGLGKGLVALAETTGLNDFPSAVGEDRLKVQDTIRFEKFSVDPVLEVHLKYRGEFAEILREGLSTRPPEEMQKAIFTSYFRAYPKAQFQAPMTVSDEQDDNALDVVARLTLNHYLRFPDQMLLVGDFALWSLTDAASHPSEPTRTRAFRIALPGSFTHSVVFDYPEDIVKELKPQSADESNGNFVFHWSASGSARRQEIRGELRILQTQIAASDWPGYVDSLEKLKPHMVGSVRVPAMRQDQLPAFKSQVEALESSLKSGKIQVVTKTQAMSLARLLTLKAALDSGRLAPELQAEALNSRGVALDYLNRAAEAKADFDEAMRLSPERGDLVVSAAANALLQDQYDRTIELANKAIALGGSNLGIVVLYNRAIAKYFKGDYADAGDGLAEILNSHRGNMPRSYAAIWQYFAQRRAGGDGAAALKDFDPEETTPRWPYAVVEMFNGKRSLEETEKLAQENDRPDPGKLCELYFFMAEKLLLDGNQREAKSNFRRSVKTGVTEFMEYGFSNHELEVLGR